MDFEIIKLTTCLSTNDIASDALRKGESKEGTVFLSEFQKKGRGQVGNHWESESRLNCLCSLIILPRFLSIQEQYFLSVLTSVVIKKTLQYFVKDEIKIKWPNDIMVGKKKISGILIQNTLMGAELSNTIIGMGINLNQRVFKEPNAISLGQMLDEQIDVDVFLDVLLETFGTYYEILKNNKEVLLRDYLKCLYWKDEQHTFFDAIEFKGRIIGVDKIGHLLIDKGVEIKAYDLKEISYIS